MYDIFTLIEAAEPGPYAKDETKTSATSDSMPSQKSTSQTPKNIIAVTERQTEQQIHEAYDEAKKVYEANTKKEAR